MGAGKTTVGRALAQFAGRNFFDLDEEIERFHGLRIRELFQLHGEAKFREIETARLRELLQEKAEGMVIALGGGTFVQAANQQLLRSCHATVVYLEASLDDLTARCQINEETSEQNLRPLAADRDAFAALYSERLKQYETADFVIHTSAKLPDAIVAEIAARLAIPGIRRP